MKGTESFDKEKAHYNLARLKKGGEIFELIVEPDKAIAFKKGSLSDVKDALMYEKIFADAKKGLQSAEASLNSVFETTDALKVAEIILKTGEIQLTTQYRDSLRVAKQKQIVQLIHRGAIDPRTNLPHPENRIENAIAEARVKIDEHKSAEDQLGDVLKKLQPIMPIRFETRKIQIIIPSQYASRSYPIVKKFGRIVKDSWHSDGTLFAVVQIPAGLTQELTEQLSKLAHGAADTKIVEGEE